MIQGKAAMHVNGDWAKGEFVAAGQVAEKDYGCVVLASGAQGYVMGGDVFAFPKPKDAATARAQALLGKVMLDPVTQIEFAKKKGSIPVRQDVDVSSLDACAQKAVKASPTRTRSSRPRSSCRRRPRPARWRTPSRSTGTPP